MLHLLQHEQLVRLILQHDVQLCYTGLQIVTEVKYTAAQLLKELRRLIGWSVHVYCQGEIQQPFASKSGLRSMGLPSASISAAASAA